MAVIRVEKTSNYTVMSNYHFREKEMTLKAKGLLSLMLSLPEEWDYSINGLVAICKEGKDGIISALKELEKFGYLTRTRTKDKGKFAGVDYVIYEKPINSGEPEPEKPNTENPNTVKTNTENPLQLNTNQLNTKELNTNINDIDKYNSIINKNEKKEIEQGFEWYKNNCRKYEGKFLPETAILINKQYIKEAEAPVYEELISRALSSYKLEDVRRVINYIVDRNNPGIAHRYSYFKKALYDNLSMINKEQTKAHVNRTKVEIYNWLEPDKNHG